ncbi:uncharacterized protein LOC107423434 isoform X3 [Ziziphus jujuba]|uniref:Uncharacterized protein LOC107423434 isoform X3 n=1 Tax=Ziziphus jujuba TaxID=326968 RepID=A0A6P4AIS0_ZIZJJ|nr:uncharacterized protein LOC107423434 isoform X3 [Ziziphus jujuba]
MESRSSGSAISIPSSSSSRPPKRLLFDRRYGWVIDEWKDPSEEALAGGRGMFCILPLAKALLKMASQSVLQAGLNDQLHKLKSSVRKPDINNFFLKGNSSSQEA